MREAGELELDATWLRRVRQILERHVPGRPVYAFGSRTRGTARRRSDLDVAIGGTDALDWSVIAQLKDEFSESDLPIFVDVLDIRSVDPEFLKRIERDFVLVQEGAREEVLA